MANKGKQEVSSARNLLDATLQYLVDKKEDGDFPAENDSCFPLPDFSRTAMQSPKKLAMRPNRKRKRKDDSGDFEVDEHQTVIMKLFDRSVDLAQFAEASALYPVCRAWIHNRPHDKSLGTLGPRPPSPGPVIKEENDSENPNVYELPPPIKIEDKPLRDLRVPDPVEPSPDAESLDIHADPQSAPPAENLLLNHMARWKEVRSRWHAASLANEQQYVSVSRLEELYDPAMTAECQ